MQACLGAKAKTGERNVVELTAEDENGQEVTHTILSLCVGGTEQVRVGRGDERLMAAFPKPCAVCAVWLPEARL